MASPLDDGCSLLRDTIRWGCLNAGIRCLPMIGLVCYKPRMARASATDAGRRLWSGINAAT